MDRVPGREEETPKQPSDEEDTESTTEVWRIASAAYCRLRHYERLAGLTPSPPPETRTDLDEGFDVD